LPSGEYILDQDDPRVGRMVSFTERCFEALPRPAHGFAFHLELFEEDESAELVFCEVACRQGGGTINQVYEQAFGLMLLETSVRLQASLPIPSHSTRPRQSVGGLQAPLRRGTIHRASEERPPFGWIVSHEFRLKSGEQATGRRSCVDSSADFVVRGESAMQVLSRLREVNAWHEGITTWTD